MKAIRTLSIFSSLFLLLLACVGTGQATPTQEPPEPTTTSIVAHREDESMLHAGVFRLTVTMVTHLSNAMMLTVVVENTSDQAAEWSPVTEEAHVQDGDEQLAVLDAQGIFEEGGVLESGAEETGRLIFPLAKGDTFRFYYPDCEPEYVTLRSP
jgi:hypothetical protein